MERINEGINEGVNEEINCPPGTSQYRWQPGDSLLGIATQNRTTMSAIRAANPQVDFDGIAAGTVICLPRAEVQCPSGDTYTVRAGDSIASIARALNVSAGTLMERNPYVDPEALAAGQVLCVPESPPAEPVEAVAFSEPQAAPQPESSGDARGRAVPITPLPAPIPNRPTPTPTPPRPTPTPPRPTPTPPRPTPTPPRPTPTPTPPRPTPTPPRPTPTPTPPRPTPTPPRPTPTPTPPRPTPTPPAPSCPPGYTSGTVRYGQTLTELLTRYNISYQAFTRANPSISATRLVPGQRFCIPPVGQRSLCGTGRSYVIRQNESLDLIARRLGVSAERLLLLNQTMAPGDFIPGRAICIPG